VYLEVGDGLFYWSFDDMSFFRALQMVLLVDENIFEKITKTIFSTHYLLI